MAFERNKGILILGLLFLADVSLSEFVPVYMWGTHSTSESVPALHKISQSSFKDDITNRLKSNPKIVVFAEESLSPEDFGQRDRSGNTAYPNLSKVKKTSKVTYLSYVQNPIKATKHASDDVSEISIERLNENFEIPRTSIVIIDLNDARENEQRFDMLKRHDEFIASAYDKILKEYDNVLALYTAQHASWIGSGEVHSRKSRSLLAADAAPNENQLFENNTIFFYTKGNAVITSHPKDEKEKSESVPLTYSAKVNDDSSITLSGSRLSDNETIINVTVDFEFVKSDGGYWYLQKVAVTYGETQNFTQMTNTSVYAPLTFSYACGDQTFRNDSTLSIKFPDFQVQPVKYKATYLNSQGKFDDPYNCVGFTTIPIWSGLFVTFILLLIMTFGITMMMDIKTMDRFDDAKGKSITINTSE